jgi:glycerol-3-phosphate acyltransferase PlsY
MVSIALFIAAYLLGSIPTSVWLGKSLRGIDVRAHGSGNPGATNAFRVLGGGIGTAVLLFDVAKGGLAAWAGGEFAGVSAVSPVSMGVCAIMGHTFSIFLRFRGGKGVATALGAIIAMAPASAGWAVVVFVVVVLISKRVSLGSMLAAIVLMLLSWSKPHPLDFRIFSSGLCAFIIFAHRSNIQRLIRGQEPPLSFLKKRNTQ